MGRRYTSEARRMEPFIARTGGDLVIRERSAMTGDLLPDVTDARDIGSSDKLWRKGWISELDAVVFAKNAQTLIGGWLIVGKGQGTLATDVAVADSQIDFGQAMTVGDFVVFRTALMVEYVQVGALVSGTIYAVTRNLDGSGANDWPAGGVYAILGQDGDGRIVLNAVETPRMQILLQGAAYNLATELARLGDLNGSFGITSAMSGIGVGDYAGGNYWRYDPVNGLVLRGGDGQLGIDGDGISLVQCTNIDGYGNGAFALKWKNADGYETSTIFAYTTNVAQLNRVRIEAKFPWDMGSSNFGDGKIELKSWSTENGTANAVSSIATFSADGVELDGSSGAPEQKISVSGEYIHLPNGWAPAGETWEYVAANQFKRSGKDVTIKYQPGTKLRCKQGGGWIYAHVIRSTYSTDTTITLDAYSLANATITDNYLSYLETPQGWPIIKTPGEYLASLMALPGLRAAWGMGSVDELLAVYDQSGQGRKLTANGSPTFGVLNSGVPYISLNGSTQYLNRADETGLRITGPLTLLTWFKPAVAASISLFQKWGGGANYGYGLSYVTDKVVMYVSSTGSNYPSASSAAGSVSAGAWCFSVGRFTPSSEIGVFVNGVWVKNTTSIPASIFASTAQMTLGSAYDGSAKLTGLIGYSAICAAVLSDAQIADLYNWGNGLFI